MAYYESWLASGNHAGLDRLPAMLDIVALSFAKPDASYHGGLDLSQTGLQFSQPGPAVRDAVSALHRTNPDTRILLAVGGSSYKNWTGLDTAALARLVQDLKLDGVDVDFEPSDPQCHSTPGSVRCASDTEWEAILVRLRAAFPRPVMLTVPGWSVGAFGAGPWADARPRSPWTGSMLGPLRNPGPAAADLVSVMAYDAGPGFDPAQAYAAYRAAWKGPLLGGVSVESGSPALPGPDGLMIYGWLGQPPGGRPGAAAIALAACRQWRKACP